MFIKEVKSTHKLMLVRNIRIKVNWKFSKSPPKTVVHDEEHIYTFSYLHQERKMIEEKLGKSG